MTTAVVRERAGRDIDRAMGTVEEKMKDKLQDVKDLAAAPGSSAKPWGDWGGFEGEFGGHMTTAFLTFFVPTIPFLLYRACTDYDCSVVAPLQDLAMGRWTLAGLWNGVPPATLTAWTGFSLFIAFQVMLYFLLPGQRTMGLPTPAGNVLPYKINGIAHSLALSALV
jgi:7-dehydrocholesterol reductase